MSNKRKRAKLQAKKEERRRKSARRAKLLAEGQLVDAVEIPEGAIAADLSKQAPNNSYSPKAYYEAVEFTCVDCGREEVWTATQQQWYYEVAKGPIYATAVRCRDCRRKAREAKEDQRLRMQRATRAESSGRA